MATDQSRLEGEMNEGPSNEERDVMALLAGFLRALLEEQKPLKEQNESST
ncbi:MAG: hypothetical protein AABZ55_02735 [Bdellovibrionota bacterium]